MLEWTPRLTTGHADIDRQHQEIFAKLNAIETAIHEGADKECLVRLITALLDYSYIHFQQEENTMKCTRCPFHDTNCDAHRGFISRLRSWLYVIVSGHAPASLLKEIHAESCQWLLNHIEHVDIGLLQSSKPAPEPVEAR
jgi:hemerythrin